VVVSPCTSTQSAALSDHGFESGERAAATRAGVWSAVMIRRSWIRHDAKQVKNLVEHLSCWPVTQQRERIRELSRAL